MQSSSKPYSILEKINQRPSCEDHLQSRPVIIPCLLEDSCSSTNFPCTRGVHQSELRVDISSPSAVDGLMRTMPWSGSWIKQVSGWGSVSDWDIERSTACFRLGENLTYETGALGKGASMQDRTTNSGIVHLGRLSTIGTQVAALSYDVKNDEGARRIKGEWIENLFSNLGRVLNQCTTPYTNNFSLRGVRFHPIESFEQAKAQEQSVFPCEQIFRMPLIVGVDGRWFIPEPGDMLLSSKKDKVVWKLNRYLLCESDQGLKILADQTYVNQKSKVTRCTRVPVCARGINIWPAPGK